jgi:uracil-DNA glycosylase family 4
MASKQQQLNDILARMIAMAKRDFPQLVASATQPVFGDGSLDADIVFIGEAPGKNEDLTGKPFVGAAGKFLDEMLAAAGLKRGDVYITNIVKYRPPNNRDPLPDEKQAFLPFLQAQLKVIKPKLIVTLGRHSMDVLLPGLKISHVHGAPKRLQGQVYLPLFHPAAALYNGGMRQTLLDDFAQIPLILEKVDTQQRPNNSKGIKQ